MFVNERYKIICELIKKNGAATTTALSKRLGVSIETVRKDLLELEKNKKIIRVHGGAIGAGESAPILNLEKRMEAHRREKTETSYAAAALIEEGDIIAIDSGSTASRFIEILMERFSRLTIVTASTDVFDKARNYKDFQIILCGGNYNREENSFTGEFTVEAMKNFHVKKSFIFPSAVSIAGGIETYQDKFFGLQKTLISIADEVVIMADSSKFEKTAFIKISDINTGYIFVTDSSVSPEIKEIYKTNGINLITGENKNDR